MDTTNDFLVGVQGDRIVIMAFGRSMSKEQSLRLAAWLVALADDDGKFPEVLKVIENS